MCYGNVRRFCQIVLQSERPSVLNHSVNGNGLSHSHSVGVQWDFQLYKTFCHEITQNLVGTRLVFSFTIADTSPQYPKTNHNCELCNLPRTDSITHLKLETREISFVQNIHLISQIILTTCTQHGLLTYLQLEPIYFLSWLIPDPASEIFGSTYIFDRRDILRSY